MWHESELTLCRHWFLADQLCQVLNPSHHVSMCLLVGIFSHTIDLDRLDLSWGLPLLWWHCFSWSTQSSHLSEGYLMGKGSIALSDHCREIPQKGPNFLPSFERWKAKRTSASGVFARGAHCSAPGPSRGLHPQTPIIGSIYACYPAPSLLSYLICPWCLPDNETLSTASVLVLLLISALKLCVSCRTRESLVRTS